MAKQKSAMICPYCGSQMNHHADKLIDPVKPEDLPQLNSPFGGFIEEIHCCPGCGAAASRRAE
jgi:ribosomal protein L37AE/L43A